MAYVSPTTGGLAFTEDDQSKKGPKVTEKELFDINPTNPQNEESKEFSISPDINKDFKPVTSSLSKEERLNICSSVGDEILTPEGLKALIQKKDQFICYDGFEPSGRMHIAQGVFKVINVNKLTKAGGIFIFWIADYFAMLNKKLGGDLEKIKVVGRYFIEIWRALGMDLRNVKFLWASEEINKNASTYWPLVLDISMRNSLNRIIKCCQIMGRKKTDELAASQIIYPCMQCADIFHLKADVCQLGLDQRKVNVLAIEYCDAIGKKEKPVVISHHMLLGLKQGQAKMSKSDPDSAIFMEDEPQDVMRKIKKAYCPPGVIELNPILDYAKHIIFQSFPEITIPRKESNGGDITYKDYQSLEDDFKKEALHPGDLKPAIGNYINKLLEPVRKHFTTDPFAIKILQEVKDIQKKLKQEELKAQKAQKQNAKKQKKAQKHKKEAPPKQEQPKKNEVPVQEEAEKKPPESQ